MTIWEIALCEAVFLMNNKFINNNGANLRHTQNKKTQVENQIELLKEQEQAISKELEKLKPLQKKVANLMKALRVSERVGYQFLNELVEAEKNSKKPNNFIPPLFITLFLSFRSFIPHIYG